MVISQFCNLDYVPSSFMFNPPLLQETIQEFMKVWGLFHLVGNVREVTCGQCGENKSKKLQDVWCDRRILCF
jgi:hypothetical protein